MVAKSASVKTETIQATIKRLEAVPEKKKDEHTLRESVEAMRVAIKSVLDKGYSYDEVAAMLVESGIGISGATLKQYMAELLKKKRTTKPSSRKPTGSSQDKNSDADRSANRNVQVTEDKEKQEIIEKSSTDSPSSKELAKMAKTAKSVKENSGSAEDEFNLY